MIAFVKAADKSRKTKTLTRPRKKWLSTVRIIDEDWSKWSSYRDGKLRGEERNDYELLLLEALTEDSNASESNINLLSKFIDARVRPLNKWIYDLNVVPQEFIDNMRQKPYR